MYFPRFWEREEYQGFVGWGFSDKDREEARARAQERARVIAERFLSGEPLGRYGYPDRPVREPVLQSIANASGTAAGVITRNSYGCVVLNAAEMFIADIDLPAKEQKKPTRGILQRLFGSEEDPGEADAKEDERITLARRRVQEIVESAGLALVYQTAGGLRVILSDRKIDPSSEEASQLLEHLGSDPLYVRLCRNQNSFRARLTPKPWRCGYHAPPARWPFLDAKSQESFKVWEDEYHRRIRDCSVSRLLERWGDGRTHPEIEPLLALHDQFSRADRTDLRLA
ncbi:MAG TPA: hypothetical protein VFI76_04310 [Terrimicrobiaceae bacterium]|nr:hypothetical protein [Terrimicrobiaceae bacterium]